MRKLSLLLLIAAVAGVYNSAFGQNYQYASNAQGYQQQKGWGNFKATQGQTLPWQKKAKDSKEYKKKLKEKHKKMGEKIANELKLTKEQREKSKKLHEEARKKIKPIMEEFKKERQKLRELKRSNALQDKIDEQMQKLKDLKDKAHEIHIDNLKKFESILTPEQKAKFQELKKRKEEMRQKMKEKRKEMRKKMKERKQQFMQQNGPETAPKPPIDLNQ